MKWRLLWLVGLFSKRAHYTESGKPKQSYSKHAAIRAAASMQHKTGRYFDAYKCWIYCRKWHIGGGVK